MNVVTDPEEIAHVLGDHRGMHPYGLADLDEPYWSSSTWWRDGAAVAGWIRFPESDDHAVYAITHGEVGDTLALVAQIAAELPDKFVISGPAGVDVAVGDAFEAAWVTPHHKMHLTTPGCLLGRDPRVEALDRRDLSAVEALLDSGDRAGRFFAAHLMDDGFYMGVRGTGDLVALAGTHTYSAARGVATIANVHTHPWYRRRGLARAVTSAVAAELLESVSTVGLNVRADHAGTVEMYGGLGFEIVGDYDEAHMVRRRRRHYDGG